MNINELKMVKQLLNQYCTQFDRILDAGCGYGKMSPHINHYLKNVTWLIMPTHQKAKKH